MTLLLLGWLFFAGMAMWLLVHGARLINLPSSHAVKRSTHFEAVHRSTPRVPRFDHDANDRALWLADPSAFWLDPDRWNVPMVHGKHALFWMHEPARPTVPKPDPYAWMVTLRPRQMVTIHIDHEVDDLDRFFDGVHRTDRN